MDWLIGLLLAMAGYSVLLTVQMQKLRKEVSAFADWLDGNLDRILSGRDCNCQDLYQDTLWSKVSEKLARMAHVWKQKEEQGYAEKKRVKELIADISHQTRTPVANMKLYLEMLEKEWLSPKEREFVRNLKGQAEKLEFLMQGLVKMSRLDTGMIAIQSKQANLFATLRQAISSVIPASSRKQIELYVVSEEEILVTHDRKWTTEALFNVLDNAVKYTSPGGTIRITIAVQEVFTRIGIRDTGKGIALERQAAIFGRFYREPEVHNQEGIGIGLYLARTIIELQNGYIEVQSEPGNGSEFRIYLPNL